MDNCPEDCSSPDIPDSLGEKLVCKRVYETACSENPKREEGDEEGSRENGLHCIRDDEDKDK